MFNSNTLELASAMVARPALMGGTVPTVFAEHVAPPSSSVRVQTAMNSFCNHRNLAENQRVDQGSQPGQNAQA